MANSKLYILLCILLSASLVQPYVIKCNGGKTTISLIKQTGYECFIVKIGTGGSSTAVQVGLVGTGSDSCPIPFTEVLKYCEISDLIVSN
mmetsp:Transcript_5598/g.7830  ORF Transcript_5598/g.7830 Transcript_5598/m.7830 type:complete len:90 (-) Transcript_5598:131-400(-)